MWFLPSSTLGRLAWCDRELPGVLERFAGRPGFRAAVRFLT